MCWEKVLLFLGRKFDYSLGESVISPLGESVLGESVLGESVIIPREKV